MDDRIKLLAWLTEDSQRCSMCGTSDWQWDEEKYAFIPSVQVCRGCAMRDSARDMAKDVPGSTIILLSGEMKRAELAKQREQYQKSRKARE